MNISYNKFSQIYILQSTLSNVPNKVIHPPGNLFFFFNNLNFVTHFVQQKHVIMPLASSVEL